MTAYENNGLLGKVPSIRGLMHGAGAPLMRTYQK